MKLSPEEQKLLERMKPGLYSSQGFLGADSRRPSVIIDTDRSTLEGLDVAAEDIAAKLREIMDVASGAFGTPVEIPDVGHAVFYESMGRIPCPFGDGVHRKGEVRLTTPDDVEFRFTPLSIHMIEHHGFFQGHGSRYRLEPDTIAAALGLV
ncbi:MAG: hypothetical protein GVY16_02915 [Planctomycetes bacterium]|jgi:hypothetical protein|nr:hypothetical protein [Planctomycetota bacterium]